MTLPKLSNHVQIAADTHDKQNLHNFGATWDVGRAPQDGVTSKAETIQQEVKSLRSVEKAWKLTGANSVGNNAPWWGNRTTLGLGWLSFQLPSLCGQLTSEPVAQRLYVFIFSSVDGRNKKRRQRTCAVPLTGVGDMVSKIALIKRVSQTWGCSVQRIRERMYFVIKQVTMANCSISLNLNFLFYKNSLGFLLLKAV